MTEQQKKTWNGDWARKQAEACKSHYNKGQKAQVLNGIEAGRVAEDVFNTLGKGGYKKWREEYLSEVGDRTPRYWRKAWTGCDKLNLDPATVAASGFGLVAFGKWAADQIEKGVKSVKEAELSAAVANQKKTPNGPSKKTKLEQAQQAIKKLSDEERLKLWEWIERDYDVRVPDIEPEVQEAKVTSIQEPEAA